MDNWRRRILVSWLAVVAGMIVLAPVASLDGDEKRADSQVPADAYSTGNALLGKGEYAKAITAYTEAIRLRPTHAYSYYGRGLAYKAMRKLDAAIADFTEAIRLYPRFAHAYENRGEAYLAKRNLDKALADCNAAVRLDPKLAPVYLSRGYIFQRKAEFDRAISDYTTTIRLDPKSVAAYLRRSDIYYGKHDLNNAIADLTQAIRVKPNIATLYCSRGLYLQEKGDLVRAIADFTQAIALDPKNENTYLLRGWAYRKKGDFDKAIANYSQLIEIDPQCAEAFTGRSIAYRMKGDKEKEKADAKRAMHLMDTPRQDGPPAPKAPTALGRLPLATAQEYKGAGGKKQITNSIGMKLVLIPAGEFNMGSGESAAATAAFFNKTYGENFRTADHFGDEHPQHRVRIAKPFYLGTYHVTRGQFRQFVADTGYTTDAEKGKKPGAYGWNPDKKILQLNEKYSWRNAGFEQTDEHPVVNVSWNDAVAFCKWLSRKEGRTYRLPTEAEWEYACRAGTTTRYYSGDDPETIAEVGNVADAAFKARFPDEKHTIKASDGYVFTAPVGKFKPNSFGLYDMHGNVWQWCADWYGDDYYSASPADDPTGPHSGYRRVLRGGSWFDGPEFARSAGRFSVIPINRVHYSGFRVARTQ